MAKVVYRRILVPLDFSEPSARALDTAVAFGRTLGASLDVLHIVPLNGHGEKEAVGELARVAPATLDDVVASRRVVKALAPELGIVEAARKGNADLIVMGTHGRTGLKHVKLGSVAERVVQLAPCAVLTVRPPGQVFLPP
jgi:nucleotide-binding universal stress UspA family protein